MRRPVIGIMGGSRAEPEIEQLAEHLTEQVAERGWVVLNGGRRCGVMAASARGAHRAGGLVIGVLPGDDASDAAEWLDVAIVTGMGDARNVINVLSSDVIIALPGGPGTISEIALGLKRAKPVLLLGWQDAAPFSKPLASGGLVQVRTVTEAIAGIEIALRHLETKT